MIKRKTGLPGTGAVVVDAAVVVVVVVTVFRRGKANACAPATTTDGQHRRTGRFIHAAPNLSITRTRRTRFAPGSNPFK